MTGKIQTGVGWEASRPEATRAGSPAESREEALRRASREFESLFVAELLKIANPNGLGGLFGQSAGSRLYAGMFQETLARQISEGGGIGLADLIYRDLAATYGQEEQPE